MCVVQDFQDLRWLQDFVSFATRNIDLTTLYINSLAPIFLKPIFRTLDGDYKKSN